MPNNIILHVDMDAFFTSVEQRDNPSIRGKPVMVSAKPGTRGVVSASSYEARKFGVRSAMPVSKAFALCPHGVFLPPRMDAYAAASQVIMDILYEFTPQIEQVSIDEAYLDITGTERLFGTPKTVAQKIKDRIKKETGLTISVGVAPNKFLAKIASDMNKPDGLTITPFELHDIIQWLAPMPCGRIFGVGKVTEQLFFNLGIKTIGDVQKLSFDFLFKKFGENGKTLHQLCRGIDDGVVLQDEGSKTISREHTFPQDTADLDTIQSTLLSLSRDVGRRARRAGYRGTTVFMVYRTHDFTKHSRRHTLPAPINVSKTIFEIALSLFKQSPAFGTTVRLIGLGITGFTDTVQTNLFDKEQDVSSQEATEKATDAVMKKFGKKAIFLGGEKKI